MRFSKYFLSSLFLFAASFAAFHSVSYSQAKDEILVQGNPPLTESLAAKTIVLLEWALEFRLSEAQRGRIIQSVVGYWKTNNTVQMNETVEVAGMVDGLMKASPEDRKKAREIAQAEILKGLQEDKDDEISQMVLQAYEAAHSAKSKTISLSSNSNASATNKLRVGADGFTGIYRMLRPRAVNINNNVSESGYYIEYITFLPGGLVYWALPSEGLLAFDPLLARRVDPDDFGTYEFKGGEIHILRGPSKELYVITRTGDRLNNPPSLGKGSYRRIPAADGLKLQGSFRRDPTEPAISFSIDGKFNDGGILRFFGAGRRPDGTVYQNDGPGGGGNYRIEQNTLELTYSDGRVKRLPFIVMPEELAKGPALDRFILFQEESMQRF